MRVLLIQFLVWAWISLPGAEPEQPEPSVLIDETEFVSGCRFEGDTVAEWESIPSKVFVLPNGQRVIVAESAVSLIFRTEIISERYYEKVLEFGHVPGGPRSGITIGVGYDLGHQSPEDIRRLLKGKIDESDIEKLCGLAGLRGAEAKAVFEKMEKVKIPLPVAKSIFEERVLPDVVEQTALSYPQLADLPPEAAGALISLVFNRGNALSGSSQDDDGQDRRQGMANIRALLSQGKIDDVAEEIQRMKTLVSEKERGLLVRRDSEAALFQKGVDSERRRLRAELERLESRQ
ncbi:MAG: hypothetical protein LBV12_00980 [Puniceicoccales bacterium]|jgi:hypothetical protein|nr:hypothetical protein [Puniceicoccales bacterium]